MIFESQTKNYEFLKGITDREEKIIKNLVNGVNTSLITFGNSGREINKK